MKRAFAAILCASAALPVPAQAPSIEHSGVGCLVADQHPRIEARLTPSDRVKRARLFFRAAGTSAWYYVEMKPASGAFAGVLPKPSKATKAIDYYVEAVDKDMRDSRSAEFQPTVIGRGESCASPLPMAGTLASASVAVGASAGPRPFLPASPTRASSASAEGCPPARWRRWSAAAPRWRAAWWWPRSRATTAAGTRPAAGTTTRARRSTTSASARARRTSSTSRSARAATSPGAARTSTTRRPTAASAWCGRRPTPTRCAPPAASPARAWTPR